MMSPSMSDARSGVLGVGVAQFDYSRCDCSGSFKKPPLVRRVELESRHES
jgi:hypothetical protein